MNAQTRWNQARNAYGRNPTPANRAAAWQAWQALEAAKTLKVSTVDPSELRSTGLRGCHLTDDQMSGFDDAPLYTVGPRPRWGRRRQGLAGPLDQILSALGLRDPIATDYPGMTLAQVWAAVSADIDLAKSKLPGLRSDLERSKLAGRVDQMYRTATDIRPAFQFPDSQIGSNERKKLADLVLLNDSYTADWRDAKAKYGYADPQTGIPEGPAVPVAAAPAPAPTRIFIQAPAAPAEIPWGMIGLGVLAAAGLGLAIGGRRK